jgi:hypothetical protein
MPGILLRLVFFGDCVYPLECGACSAPRPVTESWGASWKQARQSDLESDANKCVDLFLHTHSVVFTMTL